jgi:hypothetical protein
MFLCNERNIAMDGSQRYVVELSAEARERLDAVARNGSAPAKKIAHARILLINSPRATSTNLLISRPPVTAVSL